MRKNKIKGKKLMIENQYKLNRMKEKEEKKLQNWEENERREKKKL